MNIVKCGIDKCNNNLLEEEARYINYNGKFVPICDYCDIGQYEEFNMGENHESFKKVEKIRKQKRKFYDD